MEKEKEAIVIFILVLWGCDLDINMLMSSRIIFIVKSRKCRSNTTIKAKGYPTYTPIKKHKPRLGTFKLHNVNTFSCTH
jgi:hypothetical protein